VYLAFGALSLKYNNGYENGTSAHPKFPVGGKNVDARGVECAIDSYMILRATDEPCFTVT
jgi:hypothetical protein